jgi:hypothetical protein
MTYPTHQELSKLYPFIQLIGSDSGSSSSYIYQEMCRAYDMEAHWTSTYFRKENISGMCDGWSKISQYSEVNRKGYINKMKLRALDIIMGL